MKKSVAIYDCAKLNLFGNIKQYYFKHNCEYYAKSYDDALKFYKFDDKSLINFLKHEIN